MVSVPKKACSKASSVAIAIKRQVRDCYLKDMNELCLTGMLSDSLKRNVPNRHHPVRIFLKYVIFILLSVK